MLITKTCPKLRLYTIFAPLGRYINLGSSIWYIYIKGFESSHLYTTINQILSLMLYKVKIVKLTIFFLFADNLAIWLRFVVVRFSEFQKVILHRALSILWSFKVDECIHTNSRKSSTRLINRLLRNMFFQRLLLKN